MSGLFCCIDQLWNWCCRCLVQTCRPDMYGVRLAAVAVPLSNPTCIAFSLPIHAVRGPKLSESGFWSNSKINFSVNIGEILWLRHGLLYKVCWGGKRGWMHYSTTNASYGLGRRLTASTVSRQSTRSLGAVVCCVTQQECWNWVENVKTFRSVPLQAGYVVKPVCITARLWRWSYPLSSRATRRRISSSPLLVDLVGCTRTRAPCLLRVAQDARAAFVAWSPSKGSAMLYA